MRILSIETSCDETAVALLDISGSRERPEVKILGNSLFSQVELHREYGGVYPNLAKREHQKNLPILLEKVLAESEIKNHESSIDFIAVTQGPGLEPALWVGITFAEELGRKWSKPVLPVDHMEGHIWSVLIEPTRNPKSETPNPKLELPALALLVSGGHTELVLVKDFGVYKIIGRTRDDAVGEAFDKVARMLDLPYPGGPNISRLAEEDRRRSPISDLVFPRPMLHSHTLDFSYSGLKTAVLYKLKTLEPITDEVRRKVARAFEDAAIGVLVSKTREALEPRQGEIRSLIVAGGVAANTYLKREMEKLVQEYPGINFRFPQMQLSTDNAIMIGLAAFVKVSRNSKVLERQGEIRAQGNLSLS